MRWQALAIFGTGTIGALLLVLSALFWFAAEAAPPAVNERWQRRAQQFLEALERTPWRRLPSLVVQRFAGGLAAVGAGVSYLVRKDISFAILVAPILSGVIFGITRSIWWGIGLGILFVVVGFLGWSGFEGMSSVGHTDASSVELLCLLIYPFASLFAMYEWVRFGLDLPLPVAGLVFLVVLPFYGFPLAVLLSPLIQAAADIVAFYLAISFPLTVFAAWVGGADRVTVRFLLVMAVCHAVVLLITMVGLTVASSSLLRLVAAALAVVTLDGLIATLAGYLGLRARWSTAWQLTILRPPANVAEYTWAVQTLLLVPVILTILVLIAGLVRSVVAIIRWFAATLGATHVKPAGVLAAATAASVLFSQRSRSYGAPMRACSGYSWSTGILFIGTVGTLVSAVLFRRQNSG